MIEISRIKPTKLLSALAPLIILGVMHSSLRADELPTPISIVSSNKGKLVVKDLTSAELGKNWVHLKSNPSHRQLNPDHKVFDFEGLPIKKLLGKQDPKQVKYIFAIGSDGYTSMIPVEIAEGYGTLLAFTENGTRLEKRRGEQQIIYPTEGEEAVPEKYAKKAAFWNWYVRSLVAGELQNKILLDKETRSLTQLSQKGTQYSYIPPSTFSFEKFNCPDVYSIKLKDFASRGTSKVRFRSLSGVTTEVSIGDPASPEYSILVSKGKDAIPIECGGPFLIAKTSALDSSKKLGPDSYIPLVFKYETVSPR